MDIKRLILLIIIVILAGAGYFAFQKISPAKITTEQALEKVTNLPEVQDYLKRVPNGRVEVDNEDQGEYNIHVYEIKDDHTATFNWYRVSIKNGKVL